MLLARRDSLLKDCSSKLGPKDLANLRTDHFDQQEIFNLDILSQVEDNMIRRLSIIGTLHEEVQAMLTKKAIAHVRKPTTLGYYSRLFLVPKPLKR